VATVQSFARKRGSSTWLTFCGTRRELPPPCDPRPCSHCRIRWGRCRGSASEASDGITAHDRVGRNRARHGSADRVGDLLLARVLGLGRAHFPFGLNVARARHPVRMTRHQRRDGWAAASASRLSRRRSFFFMPRTSRLLALGTRYRFGAVAR